MGARASKERPRCAPRRPGPLRSPLFGVITSGRRPGPATAVWPWCAPASPGGDVGRAVGATGANTRKPGANGGSRCPPALRETIQGSGRPPDIDESDLARNPALQPATALFRIRRLISATTKNLSTFERGEVVRANEHARVSPLSRSAHGYNVVMSYTG